MFNLKHNIMKLFIISLLLLFFKNGNCQVEKMKFNVEELSAKKITKLITKYKGKKQLIDFGDGYPEWGYILSDGRVVLYDDYDKVGSVYKNLQEIKNVMVNCNSKNSVQHVLFDYQINPKNLIENHNYFLDKLKELLGVKLLDKSLESIKEIDLVLSAKEELRDQLLESQSFISLIIYIGEVVKLNVKGAWLFVYNEEEKLWEYFIEDKDRNRYNIWLKVYSELLDEEVVCLSGIVEYLIGK